MESSASDLHRLELFRPTLKFPHPSRADPDGLLGIGGDLSPGNLLEAYRNGIFPWTTGPVSWWSPDPRGIIGLDSLHISRRVRRVIRQGFFRVTIDRAFRDVMNGCARPAPGREQTWISPEFIRAYTHLHELGFAHSVECWRDEELVGGVYGVSIGGFFAGESMFSFDDNASSVALDSLFQRLRERRFQLFDTQVITPHTKYLGAVLIQREEYLRRLGEAIGFPTSF